MLSMMSVAWSLWKFQKFASWFGCRRRIPRDLPGLGHFAGAHVGIEERDRFGNNRFDAVALEERDIFLGVADGGRIGPV